MPDNKNTSADKPVIETSNHDRVVGLSIDKNGVPDQTPNFEIIGDKEAAIDAAKAQFAELAVSAVDAEKRAELGLAGTADTEPGPDAAIDALRKEHEKAAAAAEKKAEAIVNAAHKG